MIPPYVARDNENTWRWVTGDGIFEAITENYSQSFTLKFNRWMGDKYSSFWQQLFHIEKDGQLAKDHLTRVVEIGIEAFLKEQHLSVELPQQQLDRIAFLPETKTVFRSVAKIKYKISWTMTWGTPWSKPCHVTSLAHYCTAVIRCEKVDVSKQSWNREKPFADETFACAEIEQGWKRFNEIIEDMRVTLMENLL